MARDGEELKNSLPKKSGGLTKKTAGELTDLVGAYRLGLQQLDEAMQLADVAVASDAAWANVALKFVSLLEMAVPMLAARVSPVPATPAGPSIRSQLIDAVLQIWQTPKQNRAGVATSLFQTMLGNLR